MKGELMVTRRSVRRKKSGAPELTLGMIVFITVFYAMIQRPSLVAWTAVGIVGVAGLILFHHLARRRAFRRQLMVQVEAHRPALVSYYLQSRREDLFGNCDDTRWKQKIDTFLKTRVVPDEPNFPAWRRSRAGRHAADVVDRLTALNVAEQKQANPLLQIDTAALTPIQYEQYCADLLRQQGWNVRETPLTRDGGADFIAEKGGVRLVVQCKRYSKPVGNKAVQEVNSAVRLYNGNVACVVAPVGFTRQAQQEATGLSVHLMHHSLLPAFAERCAT